MPTSNDGDEPSTRRRKPARTWLAILATVLVAALWPLGWAHHFGSASSLLVIGNEHKPDNVILSRDFPHGYVFNNQGHDGGMFYAIARDPFGYSNTKRYLDFPSYRYRRIVFPVLAGAIAPRPGNDVIYAFVLLSLLGVALGAVALTRLPHAPPWLPLTVALDPGVTAAMVLSVPDALVTGLVLAAFAAMFRRRVGITCALLVVACLTRETTVLAAFALAAWPGLSTRARAAIAGLPLAAVGAWSLYVSHQIGQSVLAMPTGGVITLPIVGWFGGSAGGVDRALSLATVFVVAAAAASRRKVPTAVRAYLLAMTALLACSASNVTYRSIDVTRVAAPAVPLAIWVLTRRRAARPAPATVVPSAAPVA